MKTMRTKRAGSRGFSLVEVMVAVAIGTLLMGAAFLLLLGGQRGWNNGDIQLTLQGESRRGVDRMLSEIREATPSSTSIGLGARSVTFQVPRQAEDSNRNGVLDPGEDTNRNGLLDGGVLDAFGRLNLTNPITYSLGGPNGNQLTRTVQGNPAQVVASGITNLNFSTPGAMNPPATLIVTFNARRQDLQQRNLTLGNTFQVAQRNAQTSGWQLPPPAATAIVPAPVPVPGPTPAPVGVPAPKPAPAPAPAPKPTRGSVGVPKPTPAPVPSPKPSGNGDRIGTF